MILTLPAVWQRRFNESELEVRPRMQDAVEPWIVDELRRRFADFEHASEPDGLNIAEFDTFGPSVRTLRQLIGSYHELLHVVSDALLPNPDVAGV